MEFAQKTSRGPGFSPRPLSCSPFPSLLCQNILSGFPADSMDHARNMAGSIKQDAVGMASTINTLVKNVQDGAELMANTDQFVVDEGVAKIRVPYAMYDATSED